MQRTDATTREHAIALAAEVGVVEACRQLGVNPGTLRSWLSRSGVRPKAHERVGQTVAAAQVKLATVAERKAQLAEDLLADAQRLRAQLWKPCVERKAMAAGHMREVEIVDIKLTQPSFTDQRAIMTSIAIAVDKIQILTGEATERIETLTGRTVGDEALAVVDELAQRRVA